MIPRSSLDERMMKLLHLTCLIVCLQSILRLCVDIEDGLVLRAWRYGCREGGIFCE